MLLAGGGSPQDPGLGSRSRTLTPLPGRLSLRLSLPDSYFSQYLLTVLGVGDTDAPQHGPGFLPLGTQSQAAPLREGCLHASRWPQNRRKPSVALLEQTRTLRSGGPGREPRLASSTGSGDTGLSGLV